MDLKSVIMQMLVLFLIMSLGYTMAKLQVFDQKMVGSLSKFFSSIVFPGLIINSMLGADLEVSGGVAFTYMLLALLSQVILLPIIFLTPKLLGVRKEQKSIYMFMLICVNVGFVGFPVAEAAYGSAAFFYLGLFLVVGNFILFTIGIAILTSGEEKISLRTLLRKPALLITTACFILFLLGLKLPSPLAETVSTVAQVAVPLGMLIVGAMLGFVPIRSVFTEWRLYPLSAIKLIVIPVVTWAVLRFFLTDQVALGTLVITAGVPAASLCSILAMEYGKDALLASKGIFISTLFSVVTLPALLYILGLL